MFLWLYFPANIPVCICPCIKTVPLVLVLLHVCSLVTFRAVKSREKLYISARPSAYFPPFPLAVCRTFRIFVTDQTIITMDEAVFIAQYTFLATPAVIEEESRILGKIARRLRCEYVIRFEDDGKFYFLLETRSGYEEHFARCGWYIVSQTDFNSRLTIGMGLYESGNLAGFMYRLDSGSEDEARFWNNILVFTFFNDFRKAFFPLDNRFQGFFRLDGSLCLYLYDYCPVRRNDKITFEGKKVSNAVWRFKSGEQTDLFVKLFSIAASRIRAIQENRHRAVLIPVPASTREKHRTRYEAFCRKLSADMGVADGYGAITVAYDRAQFKGTHGNGDRTANLEFHPERFRGKCVLLVDDVLTTGATFIALRRKLIRYGAKFVIGMFLAKTIAFEDERKE